MWWESSCPKRRPGCCRNTRPWKDQQTDSFTLLFTTYPMITTDQCNSINNRLYNYKIFKMLAARDQENLVHGHHQAAASKPLNQITKTPGNKYQKTPLRIPLQDENAPARIQREVSERRQRIGGVRNRKEGNDI